MSPEPIRCWPTTDPAYLAYHDEEWGRPVRDERGLYERLCLEGFQSGLAWITILRKREAFRRGFAGFDPERVARFGGATSSGCSATRASSATAARSRRRSPTRARRSRCARRGRRSTSSSGSTATRADGKELSRRLKAAGFRFVGPTTAYSSMEACGIVNGHIADCWVRDAVEAERRAVP